MLYLHWQPGEKANSAKKDLALDLFFFFFILCIFRDLCIFEMQYTIKRNQLLTIFQLCLKYSKKYLLCNNHLGRFHGKSGS